MPKALVRHGGELLVERGRRVLAEAGLAPIVVVLGAGAGEVRRAADLSAADVAVNDEWDSGMGSSLRAGLDRLSELPAPGPDAVVVLLVDTPGITAAAVRRVAAGVTGTSLAAATYRGDQGHPVVLGRAHWGGVRELATGDRGARAYLRAHAAELTLVPCDDIADGEDMDTPTRDP
jgi:CTP:molybdopterin cytidylyltransferase MocA